jgi:hypothetical protein
MTMGQWTLDVDPLGFLCCIFWAHSRSPNRVTLTSPYNTGILDSRLSKAFDSTRLECRTRNPTTMDTPSLNDPPKLNKNQVRAAIDRLYPNAGPNRFKQHQVRNLLGGDEFFEAWVPLITFKTALMIGFPR